MCDFDDQPHPKLHDLPETMTCGRHGGSSHRTKKISVAGLGGRDKALGVGDMRDDASSLLPFAPGTLTSMQDTYFPYAANSKVAERSLTIETSDSGHPMQKISGPATSQPQVIPLAAFIPSKFRWRSKTTA